jgi:hypothetical protein
MSTLDTAVDHPVDTGSAASARATSLERSRLRAADVVRVGSSGLRTRPLRTALSTVGIAIGIAAMVAVLGLSASSQADLDAQHRCTRHQPVAGAGRRGVRSRLG